MRVKVTKVKVVKENSNVLSVGYCELQALLKDSSTPFYSVRSEGWACDYYILDNLVVSTGYSTCGEHIDYKIIRDYESKAQKINHNCDLTYEQKKTRLQRLVNKFTKEVKEILQANRKETI